MEDLSPINKKFVFARYLYLEAKRHINNRGTISQGVAINLLHDSIEVAMIAIAEKYAVADMHRGLTDLIQKIEKKASVKIGHGNCIKLLDSLRHNFKHRAVLPSRDQNLEVFGKALDALEDIGKRIFEIEFSSVSLISLISNEEIRKHLNKAEEYYNKEKYEEAVIECAVAKRKIELREDVGTKVEHLFPYARGWKHMKSTSSLEPHLGALYDSSKSSFLEIYRQFYLIYLGIDFKEYYKFLSLLPAITMSIYNESYQVQKNPHWSRIINKESSRFFIDFFTDFTLKIQES